MSASKLLVVFGATGQQGGSVIDFVINDSELSKQYKVRGVTRDPSKPASQQLTQKGVEIVKGDFDDQESLKKAFQGADTVFAMTNTVYEENGKQKEIAQGKSLADAAVAAGVKYFIFSSMSHPAKITDGKLANVEHFDAKAELEQYIRTLPIKSAFFAPASFMQNLHGMMGPRPVGDGTYAISNIVKPDTQIPFIDIVGDSGKFVGAILAEPEKYEGKLFCAATTTYTFTEIVQTISKLSGKTVKYNEVPVEVFRQFLPPSFATSLVEMLTFFRDFGYYGPDQNQLVEWSAKQARGKLTTVEEFLTKNPLKLE